MSKIAFQSQEDGTGTFTIAAPVGNTNRTLTIPDSSGTLITTAGAAMSGPLSNFTSTGIVDNATATALTIDSAGRVLMPSQPSFRAYGLVTTLTGAGSILPYGNASVPTNVGGGFNSSTYRFTAPVSGFYHFSWQFWAYPNAAGATEFLLNGTTNSRHGREGTETYYEGQTCSTELYLNSADYVSVAVYVGTIHLGGTNYSYFSGYLVS